VGGDFVGALSVSLGVGVADGRNLRYLLPSSSVSWAFVPAVGRRLVSGVGCGLPAVGARVTQPVWHWWGTGGGGSLSSVVDSGPITCGNVSVPPTLPLVLLALRLALPSVKRSVGAAGGRRRHPMAAVAGLHLPVFPRIPNFSFGVE
jgi:hypothetical protein